MRTISSPTPKLKIIQRRLADTLNLIYDAPDAVHGFISNRSIATNAKQHVKKKLILKMDLKDFFPAITAERIRGLFAKNPFNFKGKVLDALTNLVCHDGKLPQGAPTSPILSNMICYRMDKALMQLARKNKLKYTRYADDLVFSSTMRSAFSALVNYSDNGDFAINERLNGIIKSNGFSINNKKTGIFGQGARQVVTGIVVNKKCNFRRSDFCYLRNLFFYWKHHGIDAAARRYVNYDKGRHYASRFFSDDGNFNELSFIAHINGLLSYYEMIVKQNSKRSRPLQRLWTSFSDLSGLPVPEMIPERSIFKIDSLGFYRYRGSAKLYEYGTTGTAFALKNGLLITARHCLKDPETKASGVIYDKESILSLMTNNNEINLEYDAFFDNPLLDWATCPTPILNSNFPGLIYDSSYVPQEGERIYAYGFADGKNRLRKIEATIVNILNNEIVVDRAFIKGMSGGPVLNTRGDVIGVVTKGSGEGLYDRDGCFLPIKLIPNLPSQ